MERPKNIEEQTEGVGSIRDDAHRRMQSRRQLSADRLIESTDRLIKPMNREISTTSSILRLPHVEQPGIDLLRVIHVGGLSGGLSTHRLIQHELAISHQVTPWSNALKS